MSVTPHPPNPLNPDTAAPTPEPPPQPRGLRLVPAETAEEVTGPLPVITPEEQAPSAETLKPQPPLDIRLLESLTAALRTRPRWSERPPSKAEIWEHSTTGDWTTDEKSARRVAHTLILLVAFTVTYPLEWAIRIAQTHPTGFVIAITIVYLLAQIL